MAVCSLFCALSCARVAAGGQDAPPPEVAAALRQPCAINQISSNHVQLGDGRRFYVAPNAFAAAPDGRLLLAGLPNYVFRASGSDGEALESANTAFGAVIDPNGTVHQIHSPIEPLRLLGVRGLGRAGGGWDVLFAELAEPHPVESRSMQDSVARLWHGIYQDSRWTTMEQMVLPPGLRLSPAETSYAVAGSGDTIAWAVGVQTPARRQAVLVLERRGGMWHAELVPTGSWVDLAVSYAGHERLLLTVIRPDTSLPSDHNSLFLWSRSAEWELARRVVLGSRDGPAYSPRLTRAGPRVVLTWASQAEGGEQVRANLDVLDEEFSQAVVIDSSVVGMGSYATVAMPSDRHVWITTHDRGDGAPSQLQLRYSDLGRLGEYARTDNPFLTSFRAIAAPHNAIYVVGAAEAGGRTVTSLVVKLQLSCSGSGP